MMYVPVFNYVKMWVFKKNQPTKTNQYKVLKRAQPD